MLPSQEVSDMQTVVNSSLDIACTIQRYTPTPDGAGGRSLGSPTTVYTGNANLGQPSAQMMQQFAAKVGDQKSYLVRVPVGTNVAIDDQVVISGYPNLTVQAVLVPQSYQMAIKLFCSVVV